VRDELVLVHQRGRAVARADDIEAKVDPVEAATRQGRRQGDVAVHAERRPVRGEVEHGIPPPGAREGAETGMVLRQA